MPIVKLKMLPFDEYKYQKNLAEATPEDLHAAHWLQFLACGWWKPVPAPLYIELVMKMKLTNAVFLTVSTDEPPCKREDPVDEDA